MFSTYLRWVYFTLMDSFKEHLSPWQPAREAAADASLLPARTDARSGDARERRLGSHRRPRPGGASICQRDVWLLCSLAVQRHNSSSPKIAEGLPGIPVPQSSEYQRPAPVSRCQAVVLPGFDLTHLYNSREEGDALPSPRVGSHPDASGPAPGAPEPARGAGAISALGTWQGWNSPLVWSVLSV